MNRERIELIEVFQILEKGGRAALNGHAQFLRKDATRIAGICRSLH
jgi:hypothetical protein